MRIELTSLKKIFKDNFKDFNFNNLETILLEEENKAKEQKKKKDEKKKKKEEEAAKLVEVYYIYESDAEYDDDELIEIKVENEINWNDVFDTDDFPDEGVNNISYFLIGDNLYKVDVFCDAEWVGDWSMRCNVPGEKKVESIEKIEGFTILKKEDDYAEVKLK